MIYVPTHVSVFVLREFCPESVLVFIISVWLGLGAKKWSINMSVERVMNQDKMVHGAWTVPAVFCNSSHD